MPQLIKTTITLPEELFQLARMKAVQEKVNLSILVRRGLMQQLQTAKQASTQKSISTYFSSLPDKVYEPRHGSILNDMFVDQKSGKNQA